MGTVLRALIKNSSLEGGFRHTIVTLESLNNPMKEWCAENNICFFENRWQRKVQLFTLLGDCDIVHIHWWNHPLLQALLSSDALPKMRTVLWSHVNGLFVPQIFSQPIIDFPDFFVLATPYSKESPLFTDNAKTPEHGLKIIQSNAGVPEGTPKKIIKPENFNAGYVGTVDYSKMHGDLISIWKETKIIDSPLVVCGGPSDNEFRTEVTNRGVADRFDIRGVVDNVAELLSDFHVFVYPLNNTHYGTGEQVLIEAMAFGAVPVVMNNGCERFIIKDGETGIVASDKDEFIKAVLFLKHHPDIRQKMAEQGRKYVSAHFTIEKTVLKWHTLYREVLELEKTEHCLNLVPIENLPVNSPATLLLNAYGNSMEAQTLLSLLKTDTPLKREALLKLPPACFSKTRGSPFHYRNTLAKDPALERICRIMEKAVLDKIKLTYSKP